MKKQVEKTIKTRLDIEFKKATEKYLIKSGYTSQMFTVPIIRNAIIKVEEELIKYCSQLKMSRSEFRTWIWELSKPIKQKYFGSVNVVMPSLFTLKMTGDSLTDENIINTLLKEFSNSAFGDLMGTQLEKGKLVNLLNEIYWESNITINDSMDKNIFTNILKRAEGKIGTKMEYQLM